jgi:alpha-L-arabinofuranosidase
MLTLNIDTREKHTISPYLYMQFMEPLGVCDSSVDAAWDFVEDQWQPAVIKKVRELAPTMVRFGGCFASYYHWKEAVGPMKSRIPMINYCWGGMHMNHVGTHEVMDFCRQVGAEPMMVVNMESDGRMHWAYPKNGEDRFGTAEEAAQWVDYCNNPDNVLRLSHGIKEPYNIKYWQIGNETSYDKRGYNVEQCAAATERFIKEMRKADPTIKLIGWGDNQLNSTPSEQTDSWCRRISQIDGLDMVAFHHHFGSGLPDSPLKSTDYRLDFEKTWEHLMHAHKSMDEHIQRMRADCGGLRLAMTEGHFGVPGRNRNEVLSTWGAGVAYARCHNVLMRNSDILDVATLADFFGNVWQVNALLFPNNVPFGEPYFQPVAHVMSLFRHHQGEKALDVSCNGAVDVTASKTGNTIYLHIANTDMNSAQNITLNVGHNIIESAKMYYIAAKADTEITQDRTDCFPVREKAIEGNTVILPAAAVAAIEINLKEV